MDIRSLIYFVVVIAFIVILIRKKALPFLKKKPVPEAGSLVSEKRPDRIPSTGKELRYEVLAFGTYDKPNPKDFGNQIEAQLECELTRLANKQIAYHVDHVSVGSMLVLFISYEV